ncbi:MAG: DnaA regulatory inactivator Hda [Rhodocyclaceae bacterium]|nr:DnaA regulatory inactivator Hda [Rhodocyclaceae bacterium]
MKQLVLDITKDAPPRFDNFVVGANAALVAALRERADTLADHLLLWGAHGCGRSHLLEATTAAARDGGRPAIAIDAREAGACLPEDEGLLLAIDNVGALSETAQIALFNSFNRAGSLGQTLLLSADRPPLGLPLREDLRTRIGQCLVFEVLPLADDERASILHGMAERRGLRLDTDVVAYLLRHGRRDMPSLLAVMDALDASSLEQKRPITLPLLRELMQRGLDI